MMLAKLAEISPEIILLVGACVCLFVGMAPSAGVRKFTAVVCALAILLALIAAKLKNPAGSEVTLAAYVQKWVLYVGLLLWMVAAALPGSLPQTRRSESPGRAFEPATTLRGEFFAFFLFSLAGTMLVASATDLAWLFLALELTSLPTYVMVAVSRGKLDAQESAVKYFFLGAMAAAVFLYGFTLIYGATGTTDFDGIRTAVFAAHGQISPMLMLGLSLAVVGIGFKLAAFPMHFYVADVYQGAATPVAAFLAFVPKTAGFVALILLLNLVGWPLPAPLFALLWVMAALTMTLGNVLGLLQSNVKRVLAYSSIAHSGYMLVGLLAGPALLAVRTDRARAMGNGVGGVLFYLIAYGFATIGAFAVLGCLERKGQEAQSYDDIAGLHQRSPMLALVMLLSLLSLIGLPPMIGFVGKVYLFGAAIDRGQMSLLVLVVIGVVNSAISAVYYLRIASACYFGVSDGQTAALSAPWRRAGATVAALAALLYGVIGNAGNTSLVIPSSDAARQAVAQPPHRSEAVAKALEVKAAR